MNIISFNYLQRCFPKKEGLNNDNTKVIVKRGKDIYDTFYASVYDTLVFCKDKNDFEVGTLINKTNMDKNSNLLDIGSGTGHHVASFNENGIYAEGIDNALAMVKLSSKSYPKYKYNHDDVMKAMAYQYGTFTHITCLYFTIYYFKDKRNFIKNCKSWLKPGGYLILHLVNRDKFDPIIPAGDPLELISAQKYAQNRIMTSKVKFHGYDYSSKFEINDDTAYLHEEFKNTKDGSIRKNEHKLYIPTQEYILSIAKDLGFKLIGNIDMKTCQYNKQYLYILQK